MIGKTQEKKEVVEIPKLSNENYREITFLLKKYKNTRKLLEYWGAVSLNENGLVETIKDYSNQSEYAMNKYSNFSPLSGVRYVGAGYVTYAPYSWCSEWLDQWEKWAKATKDENSKIFFRENPYPIMRPCQ